MKTQVAIIGAGPSGLLLGQLLLKARQAEGPEILSHGVGLGSWSGGRQDGGQTCGGSVCGNVQGARRPQARAGMRYELGSCAGGALERRTVRVSSGAWAPGERGTERQHSKPPRETYPQARSKIPIDKHGIIPLTLAFDLTLAVRHETHLSALRCPPQAHPWFPCSHGN